MANRFEKGKHIFFLFKKGYTVQDSQLKPRYYLELDRAKQYLPYGDEIIEYAPVRHGQWRLAKEGKLLFAECPCCGMVVDAILAAWWNYCPVCGVKTDAEAADAWEVHNG